MKNVNVNAIFEAIESNSNFKADVALVQASIELSAPVSANDNISSEKARLTMINRASRLRRLKRFTALDSAAMQLIVNNTSVDDIESLAIYSQDKLIQVSKYITGSTSVFGRGRNNTLMYTLRGLYVHKYSTIDTAFVRGQLERYGQPSSSSATQASSSLKALQAFGIVKNIARGTYTVDYDNTLLKALFESIDRA